MQADMWRRRASLCRTGMLALCLASVGLLLAEPTALAERERRLRDWFPPSAGDIELRVGGGFSHLVNLHLTDFDVDSGIGYFFEDWIEGGFTASLGYTSSGPTTVQLGTGKLVQALSVGALREARSGWHGTTELWLRFLPFAKQDLMPEVLSPFITVSLGPRYTEGITPYVLVSAAVGLNIYLTEQLAFAPELGYSLVVATDKDAEVDGSRLDHVLAAGWALSFYFSP